MYVPRFGSQSSSQNLSRKPKVDSKLTNVTIHKSEVKSVYKEVPEGQILPKKIAVMEKTQLSPTLAYTTTDVKKPNRRTMKKLSTSKSSCEKEAQHRCAVSRGWMANVT